MKLKLFPLLCGAPVLLGCLVLLHAGGAASQPSAVPYDQTLELRPGQSVALPAVDGQPASLRLDHVNDSRCRPNKVCVWKGYISYSLTYRRGEAENSFVLAEDMPGASKSATQNGWTFSLVGLPSATSESETDYRVSLRVSNTSPP